MSADAAPAPAPAPDGQGDGAPADRPGRALALFGLLLVGVLGAGLGLGALVGPVSPPGEQTAPAPGHPATAAHGTDHG